MKVGIITFHFPHNYGAMIQAYAMQQNLRMMGHEAYIVDYCPKYHTKEFTRKVDWRLSFTGSIRERIKSFLLNILTCRHSPKRYDNFDAFKNKFMNLYPYKKGDNLAGLDAVLIGSDQVWSQFITNNEFDGPYYGDGFETNVFAYAASMRYDSLTETQKIVFAKKFKQLTSIGVREISVKELLQPLTDKTVEVTLDPTMLSGAEVYNEINLTRPIKEKYVLTYEIGVNKKLRAMASKYANKHGYKVVSLCGYFNLNGIKGYDLTASPEKFLAYIKHAECVFTTSFHGTALSIVFNKEFYAVKQHNTADARMDSILSQLGLLDRFIEFDSTLPNCTPIDYNDVVVSLNELRSRSKEFIVSSLNKSIS